MFIYLKNKKDAFIFYIRRLRYFYFFKRIDLFINGSLYIRGGKGNNIFGSNITVMPNCIFECFGVNSKLQIGDNCVLSYGVVVAVVSSIKIGNYVWIGEYTSIRDATHRFSINNNLGSLDDYSEEIIIGNNVWIGKGCIILPGTIIGDNVIIAANSVVKGNLNSNSLYGGCPVKFKKSIIN